MSKLTTVSKRIKADLSASTDNFDITFSYQHEVDKAPDMVTAKAVYNKAESDTKLRIDLTWYPATRNLNITCHNTPEDFKATVLDELTGPINEIMQEFN
jgi:hypothetical protein